MAYATLETAKAGLAKRVQPDVNTGCWLWDGRVDPAGYGVLFYGDRKRPCRRLAHRLAFELASGREPIGMVRHSCDTPLCVNPAHLQEGTAAQNTADMVSRGRHKPKPNAGKRDPKAVELIGQLRRDGVSRKAIHRQTGFSATTIRRIIAELERIP